MGLLRTKQAKIGIIALVLAVVVSTWISINTWASNDSSTADQIRSEAQDIVRTAKLTPAPADEVLHVSVLHNIDYLDESTTVRREFWIDDANNRALKKTFGVDGSLTGKTLVIGNRSFETLPGGRTIVTQTLSESDPHLLGPKSDLWAYRAYYETGRFHIMEREDNDESPIRFSGKDPSNPGLKFDATLHPSTLLLANLTVKSLEGTYRLSAHYEQIETISVDDIPSGLFDIPTPEQIVKQYVFLSLDDVRDLSFDVYYLGRTYGEYELRSILYTETNPFSTFLVNPGRSVGITYQMPGTAPGNNSIAIVSRPVDMASGYPEGEFASRRGTTISKTISGTHVFLDAPSHLITQLMRDELMVLTPTR